MRPEPLHGNVLSQSTEHPAGDFVSNAHTVPLVHTAAHGLVAATATAFRLWGVLLK